MEIKLKSYFIEIPDDRLNLFSKIKNKLDKNNLYDKIITDIQTIDIIDPKKFKSIKNDEKEIILWCFSIDEFIFLRKNDR